MLWTILGIALVLWALGMLTSHRLNGLIHVLPVLATIILILRLVTGMVQVSLEANDKLVDHDNSTSDLAARGSDGTGGR